MNYKAIQKTDFYKDTYLKIAELKKDFAVNHSFLHINHVINNAKKLAKTFSLNKQQRRLLYIACALHDVGYLEGREEHAQNGSKIAQEFLLKNKFNEKDTKIICDAIANHGGKSQDALIDPVSMCLAIADKLDFTRTRYKRSLLKKEKADIFCSIVSNDLSICENTIVMTINVLNKFSIEGYENEYFGIKLKNFLNLLSNYLHCKLKIQYNYVDKK